MAEMVASALVQEGVSGVVSLAVSHREEKASQGHLMERLEMAQSELEFALERSSKMPITDVSLLRRRMVIKCAFEECTVMLHKHKDEEVGQRTVPVSSSFRRMIMHAVQPSVWYFSSPKKDLLTRSEVERFEWFAEKADKFFRDVESSFSLLARYRFSNPLVTQLLEGQRLAYFSEQGNRTFDLTIRSIRMEEHGVMAIVSFEYRDREAPMNSFGLHLQLRLSESTDIVGISSKCLQSVGPNFKCLAEVATVQLAHLSTQVHVSNNYLVDPLDKLCIRILRTDPLCCTTSGLDKSCSTSNAISSELCGRFPEPVTYFSCSWNVSAADYNLSCSTKQVNGKTMMVWPYVEMRATFTPHSQWGHREPRSLHHLEETIHTEAINCFSCQPKQTEYDVTWVSSHGAALFKVSKPTSFMRCAPRTVGDGSMTRRESKRKR